MVAPFGFGFIPQGADCCSCEPLPPPPPECETQYDCGTSTYPGSVSLNVPVPAGSATTGWHGDFTMAPVELTTIYGYDLDDATLIEANLYWNAGGGCAVYVSVKSGNIVVQGVVDENDCVTLTDDQGLGCAGGPANGGEPNYCAAHIPLWRVVLGASGANLNIQVTAYAFTTLGIYVANGGGVAARATYSASFPGVIVDGDLPPDSGPFVVPVTSQIDGTGCAFPESVTVTIPSLSTIETVVCDQPNPCRPSIPYNDLVLDLTLPAGDVRICLFLVGTFGDRAWEGTTTLAYGTCVSDTITATIRCVDAGAGDGLREWTLSLETAAGTFTYPLEMSVDSEGGFVEADVSGLLDVCPTETGLAFAGTVLACTAPPLDACCTGYGCCPPALGPSLVGGAPYEHLSADPFTFTDAASPYWSGTITYTNDATPSCNTSVYCEVVCDGGTFKLKVYGGAGATLSQTINATAAGCAPISLTFPGVNFSTCFGTVRFDEL